jgi:peptide/nickel transport system substrate-binding protein
MRGNGIVRGAVRAVICGVALAAGIAMVGPASAQKVLRWAAQGDAETMDPHGRFEIFTLGMLGAVYEPLVRFDADLRLQPGLAVKWEQVEPLRWRFTLRPGVKFHDGGDLTADDVVFSVARTKTEGSGLAHTLAPVARAERVDALTVDLVLARAYPALLNTLAFWSVMDEGWSKANGAERPVNLRANQINAAHTTANGTGPFRLVSRRADQETVFERNPGWWGAPRPDLDRVVFTPIASDATRVAGLVAGNLDLIDPLPIADVARMQTSGQFKVVQRAENRVVFLGMDQHRAALLESDVTDRNPFKDVRVRRAVWQAIDTQAIRERTMRGAARAAGVMMGPDVVGYDAGLDTPLPFDPAAARALLAEAGYPNGFSITLDCPNDRYVNDEEICQAVTGMLTRVGIRTNLRAVSKSIYFNRVLRQETSFYLLGWAPGNMDATDILRPLMHTRGPGSGLFNVGGWSDPRVDEITGLVELETDVAKRNALIQEAFRRHKDGVGHVPLMFSYVTWGMRNGVEVQQRADGVLPLATVRMP